MSCNGTVGRYFESDEDAAGLNEFEAAEVANVLLRAIIDEKLWTHKEVAFWRDSRFGPAVVGIFEDDSFDDELMGKMGLKDDEEMEEEDEDYETDGESSDDDELMLDEESGEGEKPEGDVEKESESNEKANTEEEESDIDEENQLKKCETPESAQEENPAAPCELPFQRGGIFPMALRTRAELRPARPDFGYTWFSSRTSH